MSSHTIKSSQLSYKLFGNLFDDNDLPANLLKILTKQNHSKLKSENWQFPKDNNLKFKDARVLLLRQAGALKADDTLDELIDHIYQKRGRSITE